MKKENKDGIIYRTRVPKMNIKEDWQIKLEVISNTDRDQFDSDKEYTQYIEQHTKYAIEEQATRLKKAWKDLNRQKQTISTN